MAPKSKGSMISIPSEIISEILYRLPAKSLGPFRCVSKKWLSIISDPKFIETHLKTTNQNHIIFSTCSFLYSNPLNHHEESLLTPIKFHLEPTGYFNSFGFCGSCDGLVLVYVMYRDATHDLLLINPTTWEFRKFPDSGFYDILCDYDNVYRDFLKTSRIYGLGYDSMFDDYKVVTISHFYFLDGVAPNGVYVQVYSLRTNTWLRLNDSAYDYLCAGHYFGNNIGVFVNGFIHWIARKPTDHSRVIVAFSLADEIFSEVTSPKLRDDVDIISKNDCRLFVFGGKLAIFVAGEVWLMNEYGKAESWTKILIHGLNKIQIDKRMEDAMVFDDHGKILLAKKDRMLIYDVGKTTFGKTIYVNSGDFRVVGTFVESLVSPKFQITN